MAASWQQNLAVLVGHRRQGMAWIGSAAVCTPTPVWSGPSSKQRYRSIATDGLPLQQYHQTLAHACSLNYDGSLCSSDDVMVCWGLLSPVMAERGAGG